MEDNPQPLEMGEFNLMERRMKLFIDANQQSALKGFKETISDMQEKIDLLSAYAPKANSNLLSEEISAHEHPNFRHRIRNREQMDLAPQFRDVADLTNLGDGHMQSISPNDIPRLGFDGGRRQTFQQQQDGATSSLSWLDKRISPILPVPIVGGINRTVVQSDPSTCQFRLTQLSFSAVYYWSINMMQEQQKYPYELLLWGSYIDFKIILQLQAYDSELNITGNQLVIRGKYLVMDTKVLWHLILSIVLPNSEPEWIAYFEKIVRFTHLPPGYIIDITKWDFMYNCILQFTYLAKEVIDLLNCEPSRLFQPQLKSKAGKVGLIDIVIKLVPNGWGKKLHGALSTEQVKECANIHDFLKLFKALSQSLYDDSQRVKLNKTRLDGCNLLTSDNEINVKLYKTPYNNNNNNNQTYNNNNNQHYNNNNNNNRNNNFKSPSNNPLYVNPYVKSANNNNTLHNISDYDIDNNFPSYDMMGNVARTNVYNPLTDENVNDFDYSDPYVDSPIRDNNCLNPMYTDDNNNMYAITGNNNRGIRKPLTEQEAKMHPCFDAVDGICPNNSRTCRYSHDPTLLQREWDRKNEIHMKSPFARKESMQGGRNLSPIPSHNFNKDRSPGVNTILKRNVNFANNNNNNRKR